MSDSSVSLMALLRKTEHYDKDERYMATSDLCEVLKRQADASSSMSAQSSSNDPAASSSGSGGNSASANTTTAEIMDAQQERQVCTAVLRLLHDKSNDVQAIAVKTLGVLLTTVKQEQVLEIADSLADQVLDVQKSELRDVYAIGLRTLVKTIPAAMGDRVAQRLVGRLLDGVRSSNNEEIVLACLDILTDLLGRFGATAMSVTRQHEPILQMCLTQLSSSVSPVVRKRAGNTIGYLSVVLSDALLMRMVEALLSQIDMAEGVGKEGRRKTRSAHKERDGGSVANNNRTTTTVQGGSGSGDTCALIRTMCTVSGAVGHRLGQEQIDRIIPIFLRFTDPDDAATGDDDDNDPDDGKMDEGGFGATASSSHNDKTMAEGAGTEDEAALALANELRESCFMGFESFVLRCPTEVEPHLQNIIQAALAYMSYDPNYSYGVQEGDEPEAGGGDDDDEEFEDVEEENEYEEEEEEEEDDDDDESWKVRRSAIRALNAVVEAKKHDPSTLWTTSYAIRRGKSSVVAAAIMNRFKEREENCRVGIIHCFTRLLSIMITAANDGVVSFALPPDGVNSSTGGTGVAIDFRTYYAPRLVKACEKILGVKKGNERSKSSALSLLSTLCKAPGGVGGRAEIASVFKHVQSFLSGGIDVALQREGTSKAIRLDALSLVHAMLASKSHDPSHIRESLKTSLLPELCQSVKEQWYKVIAQALRALAEVPRFFVEGYTSDVDQATREREGREVAGMLFESIEPLLAAHDVDQEIKECALRACAALLSSLHARLTPEQTGRLLSLLLERLKNETTRIAAIRTLSHIAGSSDCDLSPVLAESIITMASFLMLQSRSLKQNVLEALDIIVNNHGSATQFASGELYSHVVHDLAPLVVESDLHLTHLSLKATVSILSVCLNVGPAVKASILEPALALSTSSLIQDSALEALLELFKQMVASGAVDFQELLFLLRRRLVEGVGKTGVYNLAKCVAVITATTTRDNCQKLLDETLVSLEQAQGSEPIETRLVQFSLLVTGDLGRMVDLSEFSNAVERLKLIYVSYFDASSEDLKNAAAYALGNASVGSQSSFLREIVAKLGAGNKKQQYLLLSALREFIKCSSQNSGGESIASSIPLILPPLEEYCSAEEEGARTMVAECLGSLACLQPEMMLKRFEELLNAHAAINAPGGMIADDDRVSTNNDLVCWTIVTSVKLAIAGKVDQSQLMVFMPSYIKFLNQEELNVRLAALLMVHSATHHMPAVVAGLLKDSITPALFDVSKLKLERKVDLGPFTHTVDDALPLRKAALSIFATCLENIPSSLDIGAFMPVLAKSLGDAEAVQLHAHQIVIAMCTRQPTYLITAVDSFVEPLEKTVNKKAGEKTGTELERLKDWIKSALRVMVALSKLEGSLNSRKFADFVERTKANSKFSSMLAAIEEER